MENDPTESQDSSQTSDPEILKAHVTDIYNRYLEVETEISDEIARLANSDPGETLRIKRIARREIARDKFSEGFPADDENHRAFAVRFYAADQTPWQYRGYRHKAD